MGVPHSEVRAGLIEAAAELIEGEGYSALTAGRLAERRNLKRQTVHYYFGTIDELIIAVYQRASEARMARLKHELDTRDPLRVVWELGGLADPATIELTALAMRRPAIQSVVRDTHQKMRRLFVDALKADFARRGIETNVSPLVVMLIFRALAQSLSFDDGLGNREGRGEIEEFVEGALETYRRFGLLPIR